MTCRFESVCSNRPRTPFHLVNSNLLEKVESDMVQRLFYSAKSKVYLNEKMNIRLLSAVDPLRSIFGLDSEHNESRANCDVPSAFSLATFYRRV